MQALTPARLDNLISIIQRWRPWILGGVVLIVGALLAEALRGLISELSYHEVANSIHATAYASLILAVIATAISYAALTGYDHASLRFVGAVVPYRVVAKTAFI